MGDDILEKEVMYKHLAENMENIYAFSLSRLSDRSAAEDLASEIILQVMQSYKSIKNDGAFYGFMWAVANNVYKKQLRKRNREIPLDMSFMGIDYNTPENIAVDNEEITALRRELSLLSKTYRDITVGFYFNGKTCAQIASEMNISPENVRYILHKVRKMMKEGIVMKRKFGEQSYKPRTFSPDFWGNRCFMGNLFKRRLPGNILFTAYDNPVTVTEMSAALGVAAVYLEDELEILEKSGILKNANGRYSTEIAILTKEYTHEMYNASKKLISEEISEIVGEMKSLVKDVDALEFSGCERSENRLLWLMYFEAIKEGLWKVNSENWKAIGGTPKWQDGSEGIFFGHDYENPSELERLNGIYGYWDNPDKTAAVTVFNYKAIENCQNLQPKWPEDKGTEYVCTFNVMCDAVVGKDANTDNFETARLVDEGIIKVTDGKMSANFVTIKKSELKKLDEILKPVSDKIIEILANISSSAMKLINGYVPKRLRAEGEKVARFSSTLTGAGVLVDVLIENGHLILPDCKENLCMIGILK